MTVTTKKEHNSELILNVKEVLVLQSKTLPPRTFIVAMGEARTNATSPRLVPCNEPHIPEMLVLDFEADDGLLPVITPVTAVCEIELRGGQREVTVHAGTNSITVELPGGEEAAAVDVTPNHEIKQKKDVFDPNPLNVTQNQTIKFSRHTGTNPRANFAPITAPAGLFGTGCVTINENDIKTVTATSGTFTITSAKETDDKGPIDGMTGTIKVGGGLPGEHGHHGRGHGHK